MVWDSCTIVIVPAASGRCLGFYKWCLGSGKNSEFGGGFSVPQPELVSRSSVAFSQALP